MTMLNKKTLSFEELNIIAGGNAVGPVKETGPIGTGPLKETGPLPPNTCDPPFMPAPFGIRV